MALGECINSVGIEQPPKSHVKRTGRDGGGVGDLS